MVGISRLKISGMCTGVVDVVDDDGAAVDDDDPSCPCKIIWV